MKKTLLSAYLGILIAYSGSLSANQKTIPLPIDYRLIRNALVEQIYTGANQTAHLWKDKGGCSLLDMSNPRIDGQQNLVRIVNDVHARIGTAMGGQCLTVLDWTGKLETFQRAVLENGGTVLRFPIDKAVAYDPGGQALRIDQLQDLLKRFAEPKLASVKLDLQEMRGDIEKTLAPVTTPENKAAVQALLSSLRFSEVKAGETGLGVKVAFEVPQANARTNKQPAPVFNESEMQQWNVAWQRWNASLFRAIDRAAEDRVSSDVRDTLLETLLAAKSAFHKGLTSNDTSGGDPVRMFFNDSWDRVAPVLRTIAKDVPGTEGLRFLTFITATDLLYELEAIGSPLGLDISSDGLRRLGRMLLAKQASTS